MPSFFAELQRVLATLAEIMNLLVDDRLEPGVTAPTTTT